LPMQKNPTNQRSPQNFVQINLVNETIQ